jgi:hypothetical protein
MFLIFPALSRIFINISFGPMTDLQTRTIGTRYSFYVNPVFNMKTGGEGKEALTTGNPIGPHHP